MRILIVTWAWPPIGRVGALRPLGMAREWVRAGHEVHVLTGPGDRGGEYCPDLEPASSAAGAIVHRAACPGIPRPESLRPAYDAGASGQGVARRISRLRQILGQWKGFPDLQRSWIAPATEKGLDLHAQHPFDVAWSTSPPESVHFIGRALALRGIPWVPDFRDQWSDYLLARWDPLSRWFIDRITARVLAPAASITANTCGVAESIRRACGRDVACVRNGWDPPPPAAGTVHRRTLGYFGRIDPYLQHPHRLWDPLRLVRDQGHAWKVEFFAAPGGGGGASIAVPPDLQDLVRVRSPLPHAEALAEMQCMEALLVLAWEARGGDASLAGKLYEYVGAGRPILTCAPAHYEARRLVESGGLGRGGWTTAEIAEALTHLESFSVSLEARAALARESTARDLLGLVASAAARGRG